MQTKDTDPHSRPDRDDEFRIYTPASLGAAIKHYRKQAGLTQAQLAELAGLNRTYLSNLEKGNETEQLRRLLRVLKQLGVRMTLQKADW
jgi:HTH-type transcriptional regulator/antitoxin HipB